ncbi:hypothetical protein G9C98_003420 [Cotesia typhae]|uniref:Uncharacterized protein n=1 Tax=Cotesia typhae TaxID=2053667 RepID=A0A8J5R5G3_9HYME|nr:hypothetical protein G9C98_003420 [Cotesia typhae]
MIVGGTLGGVRMFWALYSQIRSRRLEILSVPNASPHISPMQLVSIALTCFLTVWFVLGNYWILKIRWPDFEAKMFDPDHWCAKTLYIFAVVHLGVIYAVIGVSIVTALGLAVCRVLACPWFERAAGATTSDSGSTRRLKRISLDGRIIREVNEDDEEETLCKKHDLENDLVVVVNPGNDKVVEIVPEIKFSSRVQFRAPEIIEL